MKNPDLALVSEKTERFPRGSLPVENHRLVFALQEQRDSLLAYPLEDSLVVFLFKAKVEFVLGFRVSFLFDFLL